MIRKTANGFEFESEAALEHSIQAHLFDLLGLTCLKTQYSVSGQICDILAVDASRRLTILELKNAEDRYVVQQLTRYYDAVQVVQPFNELIDYSKPVQLIAVAPQFHRDNHTDRKYCHLSIRFLEFKISDTGTDCQLILRDLDTEVSSQMAIPYPQSSDSEVSIPPPSAAFLRLLKHCDPLDQAGLTQLRERILRFDARLQELSIGSAIGYGRSKTNLCAEVRFDSGRNAPALYLWLPSKQGNRKRRDVVVRMRIWTDWKRVTALGHIPKGLGRMVSFEEWQNATVRPLNKVLPSERLGRREAYFQNPAFRHQFTERNKYLCQSHDYRSGLAMPFSYYRQLLQQDDFDDAIEVLLHRALEY